jgi:hypothetical protein
MLLKKLMLSLIKIKLVRGVSDRGIFSEISLKGNTMFRVLPPSITRRDLQEFRPGMLSRGEPEI